MDIVDHGMFRVTRDADFEVSDEADDLLAAVERELRARRFGEVVRVEHEADMNPELRSRLVEALEVEERQVYAVDGLLDYADLMEIASLPGFGELRFPSWTPVTQPRLQGEDGEPADVLAAIRQGDILVHHPYDSFATSVERFVEQAVADPDVLAIKMTVYRTSDDTPLMPALIRADRARQAGGLPGRAEGTLRRAREHRLGACAGGGGRPRRLRAPVAQDARQVPARRAPRGRRRAQLRPRRHGQLPPQDGAPVHRLRPVHVRRAHRVRRRRHVQLPHRLRPPRRFRSVLVAPNFLRDGIIEEIKQTVAAHQDGKPARIALKMNSLVDRRCIRALYRASQAGVPVDLNIRGICCLVPGVEGVSENIRVVSVVGRFLEHSRIYAFERGDEQRVYIGSADLMPRNLDTRVELVAPVDDPVLRDDLLDTLERSLADDTNAWELQPDSTWRRREQQGAEPRSVQRELMIGHAARAAEGAHTAED